MTLNWRKAAYYVERAKRRLPGWRKDQWARVVQIDEWLDYLNKLPVAQLDVLELSPGNRTQWRDFGFRSYTSVEFPEFDITKQVLSQTFDVIIAEHVWEHLRHPYAAARHVHQMLRDDGFFLITTPFLVRIHPGPDDYTRWTVNGLAAFLEDCGFAAQVHSWGNRRAVKANFVGWPEYGWGRDLRNEPQFPVVVWAYARKKEAAPAAER